jgi:hypothetical protein
MNLARDAVELLAAMVRIDSANPGLAGNVPAPRFCRWRMLGCT